jgi:hypothetical protein
LSVLGEDEPMLRARLLARLAGALRDEPSLEPRSSLSRQAVAIARRLGDKETLVYALTSLFMATWGPGVEELVAIAREVSRLAEETGSAEAALDALTLKGIVAWLTLADEAETADTAYDDLAGAAGAGGAAVAGRHAKGPLGALPRRFRDCGAARGEGLALGASPERGR